MEVAMETQRKPKIWTQITKYGWNQKNHVKQPKECAKKQKHFGSLTDLAGSLTN